MDEQKKETTLINTGNVAALAFQGGTAFCAIQQQFTGFAPEMLHRSIEKILEQFRLGNKEVARGQLNLIREMGNQDPAILPALDVVSIYLNLLDARETASVREHLTKFLAQRSVNQTSNLLYDLCTSALLRLEIRVGDTETAYALLKTLDLSGSHTKETIYSLMSSPAELEEIMTSQGLMLTSIELRGVIEGFIRHDLFELADKAMKRLCALDNGHTTQVLRLVTEAGIVQSQIENRMFWSVTATIHDKLIRIAEEVAELLVIEPLPDPRLPLFAATLLYYIQGESEKLVKACWSKIGLIDRSHAKCAALLRFQHEEDVSGLGELGKKLHKAEKEETFRQQCLDDLLSASTVSNEGCAFLERFAAPNLLQKWLIDGGRICEEEDELSRELLIIYLKCCAQNTGDNKHRHDGREIKNDCQAFLVSHADQLANLHPEFVYKLASKLVRLHLPNEACNIIRPLLPKGDHWLSPLIKCFLDALLRAEKYAEVSEVLGEIPDRLWDGMIWQIKARLEFYAGKFENAKNAMENGFALGANTQIAIGLFEVLTKIGNEVEIPKVIAGIPDNILSQGDPYSRRIIFAMFKYGFHERAERIVLDWFITDPQLSAVNLTEIFTSLITHNEPIHFGTTAENSAMTGVSYHDGKAILTKLIVSPDMAKGQHLLSSTSPLGIRLLEVAPKESFKEGVINYRLEERLPAIVAAFRISMHIRDSMNQGDDPFHMLNFSDDSEALIAQMQDLMSSGKEGKNKILKHELLPIMFKGHMLRRENPFSSALGLLSDPDAIKHPLPDYNSDVKPDVLLLDVYALAYIAITGLAPGLLALNTRLCISIETEAYIRQWLAERQIDNGGMLTTLPDGRPLLLTVEEIRRRTDHIAEQILLLFEKTEIVHPQLIDLDPELIDLHEVLDASVYSTLRLAATCNIPWLCIDINMVQMIIALGWPVVKNVLFIITESSRLTPLADRKYGLIRHAYEQLPFPLMYQDLFELSRDQDANSVEVLTKLLGQHQNAFQDAELAAPALTDLFLPVLANALIKGGLRDLKTIGDPNFPNYVTELASACFFQAIQAGGEDKAEYKFSLFLNAMIMRLVNKLGDRLSVQFVNLINELATKFLIKHCMNVEVVNQNLNELIGASIEVVDP